MKWNSPFDIVVRGTPSSTSFASKIQENLYRHGSVILSEYSLKVYIHV